VAERRSRILERDLVKAPPVCIDCSVNPSELLVQESVGAAPFHVSGTRIISLLELLECPHHFGVGHHAFGGKTVLGFKSGIGIDIHSFLLCVWICPAVRGHGREAARRVAARLVMSMN
jgi:hypothetical protein